MAGRVLWGQFLFFTFSLVLLPAYLDTAACSEEGFPYVLHGRVLDPAMAGVPKARITAVREGGTSACVAASGPHGDFSIELPSGQYTIEIAAEGFQDSSRHILLPRSDNRVETFVLQMRKRVDTVTVTDRGPYETPGLSSATRTPTAVRDLPQSVTVVTKELMRDRLMTSIADVVQFVPGISAHQGENNRDQLVIRGNSSSADFFLNGLRDDAQYYRDLYNLERVEALKGPNAMIFGRGGAGGVVNRVTKEAALTPVREVTVEGGAFGMRRGAVDLDYPVGNRLALRLNGMYEQSGSFRNYVDLRRSGLNPTATIFAGGHTKIMFAYERLRDDRVADRGIPSFGGRPAEIPVSTFFGNPDESRVHAAINAAWAVVEHQRGALTLRTRTLMGVYDRSYQNYVPGPITQDVERVALSAYKNASLRRNAFNQSEVTYQHGTGKIRHTFLAGIETGRQRTSNLRNTGYFGDAGTSIQMPLSDPVLRTPVSFRQSATDADNNITADIAAAYVQDQLQLSGAIQIIAGLRFDYFDLEYQNKRTREELRRIDRLVSPRAGLVYRPFAPVSLYASYSVSALPSSGDQFSSLTSVTQQMKPEKFSNYEIGAKWDASGYVSITAAAYRLDRTNTRATDPLNPARTVQTGSQRSNGFELGLSGSPSRAWNVAGGFSYQDAFIVSATTAARAGARVAQVPRLSFSLWNSYQMFPRLGCGLGITNRSGMFAAVDNTVVLPGYTRVDAAIFVPLSETVRLQVNVENVADTRYYVNADGNNNISPGHPRTIRVALLTRF